MKKIVKILIAGGVYLGGSVCYAVGKIAQLECRTKALEWAGCVDIETEQDFPNVFLRWKDPKGIINSHDDLKLLVKDYKFYQKFKKKLNKGIDVGDMKLGEIDRWNNILNKYDISDTRICFC